MLQRERKRRIEAAEAFRGGGREEQAAKEEAELAILEEFMPEPLAEEELEQIVDDAIAENGATNIRDMGRVMADVMPQIAGRADGTRRQPARPREARLEPWSCAASGSCCGRSPRTTLLAWPSSAPTQSVARWWPGITEAYVLGDARAAAEESTPFAVLADGEVAGLIQYYEEDDPEYRHAGIDVFLGAPFQGRGLGADAVAHAGAAPRARPRAPPPDHRPGRGERRCDPLLRARRLPPRRRDARALARRPDGVWRDGLLMDLLARELAGRGLSLSRRAALRRAALAR